MVPARLPLAAVLAALPLLAQGLPAAAPDAAGLSASRLKRIDAVMQKYVRDGRLSGAVTLVARHGKVVQSGAYGQSDIEKGRPMTPGTLFRIASQSKAVTSVAVMTLVEEGLIRLNDPLSKFLPAYAKTTVITPSGPVPARRPITIRDLLTHTAGIGYGSNVVEKLYRDANLFGWYFADKDEPLAASIDRLAALPFDAQPGEKFVYGYNSDILGRVVEAVSGLPLDEFFRTRIFTPLKMNDTFFFVPREKADRLAAVYGLGPDGKLFRAPDKGREGQGEYVDGPRRNFSGGAGLVSTASDYARLLQMLLNGGALEGERILSPAAVAAMTTNQSGSLYPEPGIGFGLGFSVVEDIGKAGRLASLGEFGWGGAYHTSYWVAPAEGLVGVFMTQLLPARDSDIQEKFRTLVYQSLVDAPSFGPGRPRRQ